jgi:hypothetical protein
MRHASAHLRVSLDFVIVHPNAVREPHIVAQPFEMLRVIHRALAKFLQTKLFLVARLGEVRVQPHVVRAREPRRFTHQIGRNGKW